MVQGRSKDHPTPRRGLANAEGCPGYGRAKHIQLTDPFLLQADRCIQIRQRREGSRQHLASWPCLTSMWPSVSLGHAVGFPA
jgi:hypothetical protein